MKFINRRVSMRRMNKVFSLALSTVLTTFILGSAAYADLGDGKVAKFIGDNEFTTNVYDLNARAGKVASPQNQPWSGTFWPLRSGSTANPYMERKGFKINQLIGVKANLRKFNRRMDDLMNKVAKGKLDEDTIRDMAPSEKYDLFVGDTDFSYTRAEWQSVSEQFNYIGQISMWEGSCHGWATSAIYEPRPNRLFSVMSLDGKYLIPFYPDDLKALSTRLWANSLIQDFTVAQGLRCTVKKPTRDSTGHVTEATCQGVNPGDFHVSVLEMVGARKKSFVVNRSNTRQVWNQPVAGYELTYFNPLTDKDGELNESIVLQNDSNDPFHKHRAEATKYLVGVEMKLRYITETSPSHAKLDSNADDKTKVLKVRYDLELDANNQIIGGEWRGKHDPDMPSEKELADGYNDETADIPKYPGFLWKFENANPVAMSIADFDFMEQDPTQANRDVLLAASKKAAQFRYNVFIDGYAVNGVKRSELKPQPLGKVVHYLISLAK